MWFIYSYLFIFTHFKSWRMCACKRSWHHTIQIIIVEITCLCFEKFYLIFRVSFVVWWGNLWMGHLGINTLWPSDTIWQCRYGLKLAQVMACCLLALSHYLNQCCLIIKDDMWHSPGSHLTRSAYCPASRTTLIATRFWVVMICPIIKCLTVLRVFFYFVWFVFIHHNFQFYFELCTYCNILDIYLS